MYEFGCSKVCGLCCHILHIIIIQILSLVINWQAFVSPVTTFYSCAAGIKLRLSVFLQKQQSLSV